MAIETDIFAALMTRVSSLVLSPALPVAWPNVVFTPPSDGKYLRVQFVPNVVTRVLIGSDDPHRHLGLLQVSIHWPKGVGEAAPRGVAAKIVEHFPCDLVLISGSVRVRITQRPEPRDMLVEDSPPGIQIPTMISWECFA